jgi:EAL and modified HD-GYP domain-containing signal transduction protein
MDIFIARQPIFDKNINVVAYELLYRNSEINIAPSDGDRATSSVIINGLLMMGLETLTNKKQAFIKFTRNLLMDEVATLFSSDTVVIEVLEEFESDPQLMKFLKELKGRGYTIVMDAYVESETFGEVLTLVDIIKVDFLLNDQPTIERIAQCYSGTKVSLFAEKVETQEQFDIAIRLGYTYFQGYFFAEPQIEKSKDIKSIPLSHIRILQELSSQNPNFKKISIAIESDIALSYKLLKVVNSVAYGAINRISSIHQALVRLGMKEVSKWMALIMMRDASEGKPDELVRASMIRARAMEGLADRVKLGNRKTEFFLLGIFSMMDTILQRPIDEILDELPLNDDIKFALLGQDNVLRKGLEIIIAYERADWEGLEQLGTIGCDMTDEMLFNSYFEAIRWTHELFVV